MGNSGKAPIAVAEHFAPSALSDLKHAVTLGRGPRLFPFRAVGAEDLCFYQRPTKTNGDQKNGWGFVSMT